MARHNHSLVRTTAISWMMTVIISGMCVLMFAGCGKRDTRLPMGAATIEELVARYRRAHENKDIEDLRGILIWESQLSYHRPPLEEPMLELFEMPLGDVKYIARPTIPDEVDGFGGEASYLIGGKDDGMIGPICGKLLLVEKHPAGQQPRVLDPSYIVVRFKKFDGRYYIDILRLVAKDAANAYKTNTPPKYVPQPMTPMIDHTGKRMKK